MNAVLKLTVSILFTLFFAAAVSAATFVVNTTNDTQDTTPGDGTCSDGSSCSLRAAITEANALSGSDTITLPAGTYTQSLVSANDDINGGGDWDVSSVIIINGGGEATTFVQAAATAGTATERVINVRAGGDLTLNNMTVRNGRFTGTMSASTRGAGIENNAVLTLNHVTVRDNQVTSTSGNSIGAGIHNAGTAVTLNDSTITNNVNTRSVGVSGSASAFGGGFDSIVAATIIFNNSSVSGNSAITTAAFAGFGFGAGVYLENVFNLTATNSHFDNNTGTGVLTGGGSNGNGIRALSAVGAASLSLTNCTVNGNVGNGTGTSSGGTGLQLFTVTSTAATLTTTIDRTTINGNTGNSTGIGIGSQTNGGNLTVNVLNSTISNNAGAIGAGILATNVSSTLASVTTYNFTNSTISGNSATGTGGGFAVEQPGTGTVTANFNFSTIANNHANTDNSGATDNGGGIVRASGIVNIKNSLVADNTVGTGSTSPDISGAVVSGDYNHFEDLTGAVVTGTTTNNATGDPNLGPLQNNGGPTQTHEPAAASPVLNTIPPGTNDCGTVVTTDQRISIPRPSNGGCDKGSVERVGLAPGPWNLSGFVKDSGGRPVRNVSVVVSGGSLPQPLVVQTGMLGEFGFSALPGASYTVSISAKRVTFTPASQVVNLGADTTNVTFTSDPGGLGGGRDAKDGVLVGDKMAPADRKIFEIDTPFIFAKDGVPVGDRMVDGILVGDRAAGEPDPAESALDGVLVGDRAGKPDR